MIRSMEQWQGPGWVEKEGFVANEGTAPLKYRGKLKEFVLYAELFAPRNFSVLLRDAPGYRLWARADRESGKFRYELENAGSRQDVKEFDLEGALSGQHPKGQVFLEARMGAERCLLTLNGIRFPLERSEIPVPPPEEAEVGVLSEDPSQLWAWILLTEAPGAAFPPPSGFNWKVPDGVGDEGPLLLTSLSAGLGGFGQTITALGSGFNENTRIHLAGKPQVTRYRNSGSLEFDISPEAESGQLVAVDRGVPGRQSLPLTFSVAREARITDVQPAVVAPKGVFTVFGSDLLKSGAAPKVSFGSVEAQVTQSGPASVKVEAPNLAASAYAQKVTLTYPDGSKVDSGEKRISLEVLKYYDLLSYAKSAVWTNGNKAGAGLIEFNKKGIYKDGYVLQETLIRAEDGSGYTDAVYMRPPSPEYGYLQGVFKACYLMPGARLYVKFGFKEESSKTDGVTFSINFLQADDGSDAKTYAILVPTVKLFDRSLFSKVIELNGLLPLEKWKKEHGTNLTGRFILRVEPNGNSLYDDACWMEARVGTPILE